MERTRIALENYQFAVISNLLGSDLISACLHTAKQNRSGSLLTSSSYQHVSRALTGDATIYIIVEYALTFNTNWFQLFGNFMHTTFYLLLFIRMVRRRWFCQYANYVWGTENKICLDRIRKKNCISIYIICIQMLVYVCAMCSFGNFLYNGFWEIMPCNFEKILI